MSHHLSLLLRAGRCWSICIVTLAPALVAADRALAQPVAPTAPATSSATSSSVSTAPGTTTSPASATKPVYSSQPGQPWYEVYSLTDPTVELDDIYTPHKGTIDAKELESPIDLITNQTRALEAATGLRLGFAYTMIFQQASAGPGTRNGTSGDLDIMADWTLVNRGGIDTGRLVLTGEYRHKASDQPASRVGPEIGALTNTTGGFNDRGWAVRDGFWAQRAFDDHLRIQVGRFDISDNVGAYRMQGINNSFSNRAFSGQAAAAFPGHGPGALATIRPSDSYYVTAGATNANGDSTKTTLDDLSSNWDMFYTAEAGYTPLIDGLGRGRYALMFWHVDARKDPVVSQDQGIIAVAEQDLGDTFYAFARYQYADKATQRINQSVQVGMGINGLLGSAENLTGVAVGWAEPANSALRDEMVIETFHRWQLTRYTQFSVGIQGIFDPSNAPNDSALAVFTARFRIAF